MNPNQYTLVKHTILPLIYRVVHPEIHKISTSDFWFYFSLPSPRPSDKLTSDVPIELLNSEHFFEYTASKSLINWAVIKMQT